MGDAGQEEFLELLGADERKALVALGRRQSFPARSILMYEGQVGDKVIVLLEGRVKISYTTAEGREAVLRFAGPGELIGELAVIDGRPRLSTVSALEAVEALAIPAASFLAFVEANLNVASALLRMLSRRFRDSDQKRIQFGASDTIGRLSARLLELAESHGERAQRGIAITLPLTQEELGSWCGCSREAVAKGLRTLRALGLIETDRRRLVVLDGEGLRDRAG
jgi:CRP/FNR family cyclic AMP-dependent transcriptional regulator